MSDEEIGRATGDEPDEAKTEVDKEAEEADEGQGKGRKDEKKTPWTPSVVIGLVGAIAAIITAISGIALPIYLDSREAASPPSSGAATVTAAMPTGAVAYELVPLGTAANATLDFLSPPSGNVTLGGVPFQVTERVFKSQALPSPNDGYPASVQLEVDVPRAQRAHLLLNAGNGYRQFNAEVVGRVVAYCDNTAMPVAELQLGREVREWHVADNVVSVASRAQQVWSGAVANAPDVTGHIDLLSFDLPSTCWSGRLTGLELIDTSASSVGSLDPALTLVGVTIEYGQ